MQRFKRQIIDDVTRLYHNRSKLTDKRIEAASKGAPPSDDEEDMMMGIAISMGLSATAIDPSAPVDNPILEAVLEIEGVESAAVTAYSLMVKRSPQFSWDEIENKVLKLFSALNMDLESSKIKE